MTQKTANESYLNFFRSIRGNAFNELFRGYTMLLIRTSLNWTVFLQTDLFVKSQIRSALSLRSDEEISSWYLIPASSIVAIANTSLVMPFDCVKTHMEKVNPTSTYGGAVGAIYQAGGVLGFFTGVRLRFMLYFTNALFTVNLLEKLESIVNSAKRKNA